MFEQSIWPLFRSVVLISLAVYIGLMIMLSVFQSRYIYFPEREIYATPRAIGLEYKNVYFAAQDGIKLFGWLVPAEMPRGTVLFFHGNGGNISHRLESIKVFNQLGLNTFIFDYRGYGQSEGKTTEKGTYLDAQAAWRYLVEKENVDPATIIFFGRSLGGAIAAWLAQDHEPQSLILESVFTSVQDMAANLYPFLPVKLLSRFNYSTLDYLQRVTCPILVVHSPADEIIPFAQGRRLYEKAHEPKEFMELTGTHNEGFMNSVQKYRDGLDAFISPYAGKQISTP